MTSIQAMEKKLRKKPSLLKIGCTYTGLEGIPVAQEVDLAWLSKQQMPVIVSPCYVVAEGVLSNSSCGSQQYVQKFHQSKNTKYYQQFIVLVAQSTHSPEQKKSMMNWLRRLVAQHRCNKDQAEHYSHESGGRKKPSNSYQAFFEGLSSLNKNKLSERQLPLKFRKPQFEPSLSSIPEE